MLKIDIKNIPGALNDSLNEFGDKLATQVIVPPIEWAYQGAGSLLSRVAGCVSVKLGKGVQTTWRDPLGTDTLLRLFRPIENLSRRLATRQPSRNRLIHFLDQSLVSHAQYLYVHLKEMNKLLELPKGIKDFIRDSSVNHLLSRSARLGGRLFVAIDKARITVRNAALTILHYVIRAIDLVFQYIILDPDVELFKYLLDAIEVGRKKLHGRFSENALKAIEKRESQIRSQIVANVADFSLNYISSLVSRVSLKSLLGVGFYLPIEKALHYASVIHPTALQFNAGMITAYFLWINVYQPYLESYYEAYRQDFNPNSCTMKEFLKRYHCSWLFLPVEGAKNFFLAS
jgi:ASC-1-like (ASCH) protein